MNGRPPREDAKRFETGPRPRSLCGRGTNPAFGSSYLRTHFGSDNESVNPVTITGSIRGHAGPRALLHRPGWGACMSRPWAHGAGAGECRIRFMQAGLAGPGFGGAPASRPLRFSNSPYMESGIEAPREPEPALAHATIPRPRLASALPVCALPTVCRRQKSFGRDRQWPPQAPRAGKNGRLPGQSPWALVFPRIFPLQSGQQAPSDDRGAGHLATVHISDACFVQGTRRRTPSPDNGSAGCPNRPATLGATLQPAIENRRSFLSMFPGFGLGVARRFRLLDRAPRRRSLNGLRNHFFRIQGPVSGTCHNTNKPARIFLAHIHPG